MNWLRRLVGGPRRHRTPHSLSDDLEARVISEAIRDQTFRASLLTTPREALAERFGISIPEDVDIVVHEETETEIHLCLPPVPQMPKPEPDSDQTRGTYESRSETRDDEERERPADLQSTARRYYC